MGTKRKKGLGNEFAAGLPSDVHLEETSNEKFGTGRELGDDYVHSHDRGGTERLEARCGFRQPDNPGVNTLQGIVSLRFVATS